MQVTAGLALATWAASEQSAITMTAPRAFEPHMLIAPSTRSRQASVRSTARTGGHGDAPLPRSGIIVPPVYASRTATVALRDGSASLRRRDRLRLLHAHAGVFNTNRSPNTLAAEPPPVGFGTVLWFGALLRSGAIVGNAPSQH